MVRLPSLQLRALCTATMTSLQPARRHDQDQQPTTQRTHLPACAEPSLFLWFALSIPVSLKRIPPVFLVFSCRENTIGGALHYHLVEEILQSSERELKVQLPLRFEGSLPPTPGERQCLNILITIIAMKFQNFMVGAKGVMYIAIGLAVVVITAKICGL